MTTRPGLRLMKSEEFADLLSAEPAKAITILYDRFSPALFGVAFRILGSEPMAEDAIQDTFVKVWQHRHQYDPKKGTVFTWLLNIVRRVAIDKTRSASYKKEKRTDGSSAWESQELQGHHWMPEIETIGLRGMVNSLDEKQQEVIDLIYFQGFTHKEVQERLNIPLGTVKSRIRLAMKKLRSFFDDQSHHMAWLGLTLMFIPG